MKLYTPRAYNRKFIGMLEANRQSICDHLHDEVLSLPQSADHWRTLAHLLKQNTVSEQITAFAFARTLVLNTNRRQSTKAVKRNRFKIVLDAKPTSNLTSLLYVLYSSRQNLVFITRRCFWDDGAIHSIGPTSLEFLKGWELTTAGDWRIENNIKWK